MSSSPQHPAFYPSRRQLWTNTAGVQPGWCSRFLHRSGLGSNCGSLHAAWTAFFTAFSTLWLVINAVSRYCAFKSQAYDPRFGSQWDETVTLNTQLIAIIIALALLPVMFYSAISRTGHLANDSILLGRDIVHLQKRLFACAYFRQLWKSAFNNSAGLVNVSQEEGSPHEEEALETLLVKRKGHNFYASLIHTFRPYSAIIYVLIVYCLLFPVSILEAEQIRNEAIHPRFVFHSNLDGILGQSSFITQIANDLTFHNPVVITSDVVSPAPPNDRPFPGHKYPTTPPDVGLEYTFLTLGLATLTVQYATPFYFTSRSFALMLSAFTALSGVFILVDVATVAVIYKIANVGIREPGGAQLLTSNPVDPTFPPLYYLLCGALGLPAILLNLMTTYAYGEEEFDRAVTNYTQLLVTGHLPNLVSTRPSLPNKPSCNGNLTGADFSATVFHEQTNLSSGNNASTNDDPEFKNEILFGLPLTIAVTTKFWRPPPAPARRTSRAIRRSNTPIPGQFTSNGSETSSTLKRAHGISAASNGSADMMASVHTLTELSDSAQTKTLKRSNYGQLSVAGLCFIWLLITRIFLAAPILRCFWNTGLRIALLNVIVTVLFLVSWLLMWFGLGVKNAWRFRLLHVVPPLIGRVGVTESNQATVFPYSTDGPLTGMLPPMMPNAFQMHWPFMSYPAWISNAQNCMTAGLSAPESTEMQRMDPVLPNNGLTGIPEAGSNGDSLYGCFNEIDGNVENPHSAGVDHYSSHLSGVGLRAGPPTLSDDSVGGPASVNRNCHLDTRFYRRIAGSASFTNGLSTVNNYNTSSQKSFSPTPFNTHYDNNSRNTSPMDDILHNPNLLGSRTRSNNVVGSRSTLTRAINKSGDGADTTYATLAPLPRPTTNPVRPPSVNSSVRETRSRSPPVPPSRNLPCRRNGSRVTFQDNLPNELRNNPEGANGSSDSGVYTNSHGNLVNSERLPIRSGRLNSELLAQFGGYVGSTSPITSTPDDINGENGATMFDEAEISTDLTSFGMAKSGTHSNRVNYAKIGHRGADCSNDQLCSQV